MKAKHNFIITLICIGLIIFEIKSFPTILSDTYMIILIITLYGVGSYHLGIGIAKVVWYNFMKKD